MNKLEREAVIVEGKLHCPWCDSSDVLYSEDITNRHAVTGIRNGVIVLEMDGETDQLASNERIFCNECGESAELPEGYETQFEWPV